MNETQAIDRMRQVIRLKHKTLATEGAYPLATIRRHLHDPAYFAFFASLRDPPSVVRSPYSMYNSMYKSSVSQHVIREWLRFPYGSKVHSDQ